MTKKSLFAGLTSVSSLLLSVMVCGSTLILENAGVFNQAFNAKTSEIINVESDGTENTLYYADALTRYGEDTTSYANALKLEMDVAAENVKQAEEGTVLLKNDNNYLPLKASTSPKITVFGNGAYNSRFNKSKSDSSMDAVKAYTFIDALDEVYGSANVATLDSVYSTLGTTSNSEVIEAEVSEVKKQESVWASTNSTAVVMLTRYGTEDGETVMYTEDGSRYMSLTQQEKDLFEYLKAQKAANKIKGIVVMLNADQQIELDWMDDYDVDSCLLVGIPGAQGFLGAVHVMAGEVNASGHTVDTYAANSLSAPSAMNAGTANTVAWANVEDVTAALDAADSAVGENHVDEYVVYAEGIYVGYKYYETRYADAIMGQGNATGTNGSSTGKAWNYTDEVTYTFGYGLSYTTFNQELKDVSYDSNEDIYTVTVDVTNTGSMAGKSVVQVYTQTPYGEYEKTNAVEKSAIAMVGFEKTDDIEPGETVTVKVEVERYLLASYDSHKEKGYILSEGDYYLAIGDNAHDALNNVLAKQGYSGMVNQDGTSTDGNKENVYTWNQSSIDTTSYNYSRYTDEGQDAVEVTNQFDDYQLEAYGITNYTYLTRSDWNGTYPKAASETTHLTATESMIKELVGFEYTTPSDAPSTSSFTQGTDVTINFVTMKDADWYDDEIWDTFINQLTVDEMLSIRPDSNGTLSTIERVAMPTTGRGDDGVCIQQGSLNATGNHAMPWVSEVITSRTWNKERFSERGRLLGAEAVYCGLDTLWYGGGNIHRTPYGGRNMQYYSEDGNMGYYVGWYEAQAMEAQGVHYGIKHFVLNDQEHSRESLATFCDEQAIRENYLRAFEGPMCKGGALNIMTGFNRIGCEYVATNYELLTGVLREEWNFKGHTTTDAGSNSYKSDSIGQLAAGIDYTCWNSDEGQIERIKTAIEGGDGYLLQRLRESTKHNVYAISHSVCINGLSSNSIVKTIVPAWQKAFVTADIVLGAVTVVLAAGWIVCTVTEKKKNKEEA